MALAVAQVGGNVTTGSGSIAATFGSTTTTGSLIVAVYHAYAANVAVAGGDITDSNSNTYSTTTSAMGVAACISAYYNNAGTRGASHAVTGNLVNASGESDNLAMIEITGQHASTPYDTTTAATSTDLTSPYDVTAAAAISGTQIAIYGTTIDSGNNNAFTNPTGYSNIINQPDGITALVSYAGYKLNETGTPTVGATSSHGTANARNLLVTFKAAVAGSASANPVTATVTVDATNPVVTGDIPPAPFLRGVTRSGMRPG